VKKLHKIYPEKIKCSFDSHGFLQVRKVTYFGFDRKWCEEKLRDEILMNNVQCHHLLEVEGDKISRVDGDCW
jgi:hypothetical protein